MSKTHYKVNTFDFRRMGQTEYEFTHQTACGHVREFVSENGDKVDCKICLRTGDMAHYRALNKAFADSSGCY